MRGVLVGALLVLSLMVAIKDGRVLRKAGLTGGCTALTTPAGDTGSWAACTPGKLQGAPDLTRQGCPLMEGGGKTQYRPWPGRLQFTPGGLEGPGGSWAFAPAWVRR